MSTESVNELDREFFEVVDSQTNIQYDELACMRAGRIAIVADCIRPAFSSSLSFNSEKRIWTNFRIIASAHLNSPLSAQIIPPQVWLLDY